MGINKANTSEVIPDGILEFKNLKELCQFLHNSVKNYLINNSQVTEDHWKRHSDELIEKIYKKIQERFQKVFKDGLHAKQSLNTFEVDVNERTFEHQGEGKIWFFSFIVKKELTPRYIKDGDKKVYHTNFQIYIEILLGERDIRRFDNAIVIKTLNKRYKIGIISPEMTKPNKTGRKLSIEEAGHTLRIGLLKVFRG